MSGARFSPTDWHNECCYCKSCNELREALDKSETHLQNLHAMRAFGAVMTGDYLDAIDHAADITPATIKRMQAAVATMGDYVAAKATLDTVNDDEQAAA